MKIVLAGTIEGINTRQDGTIKLTFGTQELSSETVGNVFQLRSKYVKCLLSNDNITDTDTSLLIETSLKNDTKVKKPSQRLRAVLYRVWEQGKSELDFEQFYNNKLEEIINHFKAKLE